MDNTKADIKKAAGYIEEETGEAFHSAAMAEKGRALRNEGRIENGELPKTHKPGTGHPED